MKKTILYFLPLWLTLLGVSSLLSLHPIYNVNWYTEKRLVQIIILFSLVLCILFYSNLRYKILIFFIKLNIFYKLALISIFVLGILSSLLSKLPSMAFIETGNIFLLFLLVIFIAINKIKIIFSADRLFIYAFILAAMAYMISFFSALLAGIIVTGVIDYQELLMGVVNRRFLNQFQSISFPILLVAPLVFFERKTIRFLLMCLAALWFMLMIFSDGRGVIVATIIGILVSGLLFWNIRYLWWRQSFLVILIGGFFYLLINWSLSSYTIIEGDILRDTTGGRLSIWSEVLSNIEEAPFLGHGPMSYAFLPHENSVVAHPHNIILQLFYEWGIPATLLIISLIFYSSWLWIEQQRKINNPSKKLFSLALTSAFIAALTHGQFSGVFVMPLSQLTFVLISGWMLGSYIQTKDEFEKNNKHFPSFIFSSIFIIVSVGALCAILLGIYPQLRYLTTEVEADTLTSYLHGNYPAYNAPRYWLKTFIDNNKI
jgi:hypothetical protein